MWSVGSALIALLEAECKAWEHMALGRGAFEARESSEVSSAKACLETALSAVPHEKWAREPGESWLHTVVTGTKRLFARIASSARLVGCVSPALLEGSSTVSAICDLSARLVAHLEETAHTPILTAVVNGVLSSSGEEVDERLVKLVEAFGDCVCVGRLRMTNAWEALADSFLAPYKMVADLGKRAWSLASLAFAKVPGLQLGDAIDQAFIVARKSPDKFNLLVHCAHSPAQLTGPRLGSLLGDLLGTYARWCEDAPACKDMIVALVRKWPSEVLRASEVSDGVRERPLDLLLESKISDENALSLLQVFVEVAPSLLHVPFLTSCDAATYNPLIICFLSEVPKPRCFEFLLSSGLEGLYELIHHRVMWGSLRGSGSESSLLITAISFHAWPFVSLLLRHTDVSVLKPVSTLGSSVEALARKQSEASSNQLPRSLLVEMEAAAQKEKDGLRRRPASLVPVINSNASEDPSLRVLTEREAKKKAKKERTKEESKGQEACGCICW
jgi:hypothetical protein